MNNWYSIFIDFDGTITADDVGYELFKRFTGGATEPLVQSYRQGRVNSLNCLSGECDIWNDAAPPVQDVWAFLDSQKLRPGFREFLANLKRWNLKPIILSEGFDFYIDRILNSHSLLNLERITNLAGYENGHLTPKFPFYKFGCGECSSCKGYHIRRLRPPILCAVYMGDGHSDFHASKAADIVFARSHLEVLLKETKRSFFRYDNFYGVSDKLEKISQMKLFTQSERIDFYRFTGRHKSEIRALWESGDIMRFVGYPNGLGWSQAKFDSFWSMTGDDDKAIRIALEDKSGCFLGEAMIAFPNKDGFCEPDLKLLPTYWGRSLAYEAWQILLERHNARWPEAGILVTPNVENQRAIKLYLKLGFEFDGEEQSWQPPPDLGKAVPIRYRRMVKKNIASR